MPAGRSTISLAVESSGGWTTASTDLLRMSPHWICRWHPSHSMRNAFGLSDGRNAADVKGFRQLVSNTGLSVNSGKTDVVIFTRRYKWCITRTLELKKQRLEISKSAKYLGVILDNKIAWKHHFENKWYKFITTLWLCRRAIGNNWGLRPDTLLWIFTENLQPRLTYALIVCGAESSRRRPWPGWKDSEGWSLEGSLAPRSTHLQRCWEQQWG